MRSTFLTLHRSPICRSRQLRVYCQRSPMDKIGGRVTAKDQLLQAKKEVEEVIKSVNCNPLLVRLAWHDAGTYDKVGEVDCSVLGCAELLDRGHLVGKPCCSPQSGRMWGPSLPVT